MSANILHVTDSDFSESVIAASNTGPVLVDYWAPWCGPCKQIAPILDRLAQKYGDALTIVKMNIDDNPNTPQKYGVRGIPTLMLFKDGEVEGTKVGMQPESALISFIDSHL